jgi:hypothetical protein
MSTPPSRLHSRSLAIVLVACGKQKLKTRATARTLYTGDLFLKARAWAEHNASSWFILSAKHGLLHPDAEVDPYDESLASFSTAGLLAWNEAVSRSFDFAASSIRHDQVIVLAGQRYRGWCMGRANFAFPLQSLGIGQQKAWLKRTIQGSPARNADSR